MADTGLTPDGFVIPTQSDLQTALEAALRAQFGASLPLGNETVLGQMVGLVTNALALVWQRAEQVNSSQDPDAATGPALDQLSLLTGTLRAPALATTCPVILCGDDGTVVAPGNLVATASTAKQFSAPTADGPSATITLLPSWAGTTSYSVGDRVTNASRCFQCVVAGTSAGSGGPTTTADSITDGGVTWRYIGEGTGAVDSTATATATGPIVAIADDITVIQTPIPGWRSVRNIVDATVGQVADTDQNLRLRRESELAGLGSTTGDATRAALTRVTGVTMAEVFQNRQDVTDANGLPPHSFECLVIGGADQDVVDAIASNQPDGIATYGLNSGTHVDSVGNSETVLYTRPVAVTAHLYLLVTYDANLYPLDGDAEIKTAISTFAQSYYLPDSDVDPTILAAQAFQVQGVRGCVALVYTDVIGAAVAWMPTTGYSATVGSRSVVTNGGRYYICTTSGTSAGSGGPTGTGTDIVDGSVHWYFLGNVLPVGRRQLADVETSNMVVSSSAVIP
jgi:hypothetical protein